MKVAHYNEVKPLPPEILGIKGSHLMSIRPLINNRDGAQGFSMSLLSLSPSGHTPSHRHQREEEVFVKSGTGMIRTETGEFRICQGSTVYIAPDEIHQFVNDGPEDLELLCLTTIEKGP